MQLRKKIARGTDESAPQASKGSLIDTYRAYFVGSVDISRSDAGLVKPAGGLDVDTLVLVCRPCEFGAVPVGLGRAGIMREIKAVLGANLAYAERNRVVLLCCGCALYSENVSVSFVDSGVVKNTSYNALVDGFDQSDVLAAAGS